MKNRKVRGPLGAGGGSIVVLANSNDRRVWVITTEDRISIGSWSRGSTSCDGRATSNLADVGNLLSPIWGAIRPEDIVEPEWRLGAVFRFPGIPRIDRLGFSGN